MLACFLALPAKYGMQATATQILHTMFEASCAVQDTREDLIRLGHLEDDTTYEAAFAWATTRILVGKYGVNPLLGKMIFAVSKAVCTDEVQFFFETLLSMSPKWEFNPDDESTEVLFEPSGIARQGRKMGHKKHWGIFLNDEFKRVWNTEFQSS